MLDFRCLFAGRHVSAGLLVLACAALAACGGGGGGGGGSTDTAGTFTAADPASLQTVAKQAANPAGNNITGAVNTTDATCSVLGGANNVNQFEQPQDVYLRAGSGQKLPAGDYYVRVTSPQPNGDESLLGTSGAQQPLRVNAAGAIVYASGASGCVQLWSLVTHAGAQGFAATPNAGGVYKVWISLSADFTEPMSRTDNFIIKAGRREPPVPVTGRITAQKFYDADLDGQWGAAEPAIQGWNMQVLNADTQSAILATGADGSVSFGGLTLGDYLATERKPVQANASLAYSWYATNAYDPNAAFFFAGVVGADEVAMNKYQLSLTSGAANRTVAFGNVCVGPAAGQGGHTLGYWSNKNGKADIDALGPTVWDELYALGLVKADGTPQPKFTSHAEFSTWLLDGNAKNMAYMLSVQLAAMKLNVLTGKVDGNAWIRADGVPESIGSPVQTFTKKSNFMSVSDLIAASKLLLANAPLTLGGHSERELQERAKDALDNGNNNRSFLQSTPVNCPLSFG